MFRHGLHFSGFFISVVLLMLYHACVPLQPNTTATAASAKPLLYQDQTYEPNIHTVLLYPNLRTVNDMIQPAVSPIEQLIPLRLVFDDLTTAYEEYYVQIIHCNANWTKSTLNNIEYMYDFNEFPILDNEISFNTRTPYVHYTFDLPRVKISGNYLLIVYRGRDKNDLILSKRFMIYEQSVIIDPKITNSSSVGLLRSHQQLEFNINYGKFNIINPMEEVKVVVRQNQRWDNAIVNLKPTFISVTLQNLEYRHFDLANNFHGIAEYRFFDLRTVNFLGQNVAKINLEPNKVTASLFVDKGRGQEAYSQIEDINGQFVISNAETGDGNITGDYVNVQFNLLASPTVQGDIYIAGALTNYDYQAANRMVYNPETKLYHGNLLLKQGFYNYLYYVKNNSANPYVLEGSHFETENNYEIIAYYRPVGARSDLIIGYASFIYNRRF